LRPSLAQELAGKLRGATEIKVVRERKGRSEELDILPSIHCIDAREDGTVEMVLRLGGSGNARPDDVLRGLFGPGATARIVRQDLLVMREGEMLSPMSFASRTPSAAASLPEPRRPPGPHPMIKELILNAGPEETRAALLEDGLPAEIFLERASSRTCSAMSTRHA
jgi:hypothetical protein